MELKTVYAMDFCWASTGRRHLGFVPALASLDAAGACIGRDTLVLRLLFTGHFFYGGLMYLPTLTTSHLPCREMGIER